VIHGTRLAVEFILEMAAGQSESRILANYPGLTRDDILAYLSYASYLARTFLVRQSRFYAAKVTMFYGRARTVRV